MIDVIREYIGVSLTDVNERLGSYYRIREVTNRANMVNLPSGQTDTHYLVLLSDVASDMNIEASGFSNVTGRVEFSFNLTNQTTTQYRTVIDNLLFPLLAFLTESAERHYKSNENYATSIQDTRGLGLTNLDRWEGQIFQPSLEFEFRCYSYLLSQIVSNANQSIT